VRACRVILTVALAAVLAGSAAGATRSDADSVKALLQRETALFNAGKWKALYALYTPAFRAKCPFGPWAAVNRQGRKQVGPVTTTNITVRVSGKRAVANYVVKNKTGRVLAHTKGDVYVKIAGRWLDQQATCA